MAMTVQQQQDLARRWVADVFVGPNVVASFSHQDLLTTIGALDTKLDATVSSLGLSLTATLLNALAGMFTTTPMSGATVAQKSLVLAYVLLKRGGAI